MLRNHSNAKNQFEFSNRRSCKEDSLYRMSADLTFSYKPVILVLRLFGLSVVSLTEHCRNRVRANYTKFLFLPIAVTAAANIYYDLSTHRKLFDKVIALGIHLSVYCFVLFALWNTLSQFRTLILIFEKIQSVDDSLDRLGQSIDHRRDRRINCGSVRSHCRVRDGVQRADTRRRFYSPANRLREILCGFHCVWNQLGDRHRFQFIGFDCTSTLTSVEAMFEERSATYATRHLHTESLPCRRFYAVIERDTSKRNDDQRRQNTRRTVHSSAIHRRLLQR